MSFLNPFMLFGIAAVSVPIVIHLLNKRKFIRVRWAAMRFLNASVEQNQRRLNLEDLLLLLIRCALIALVALAVARPAFLGAAGAAAGLFGPRSTTAVVIVDNSYSMSATDGVTQRFDSAKKAADEVIAAMPGGSASAVWLASDAVQPLISEPTYDLNLARAAVRNAKLCDRGSDLLPAIRGACELLAAKQSTRKEIYLVTDGQRLGWRQLDAIRRALDSSKGDVRAHVMLVGSGGKGDDEPNLCMADLREVSGLPAMDRPLRFTMTVTNTGRSVARDVRVSIRVDGDPPADETTIDQIPPGESRSASLFAKLRTEGYHTVTATLPGDHLPADDSRAIVVRGLASVKVLLVDGDVGPGGLNSRDAETFFLRNAMAPVTQTEAEHYFVKPTVCQPGDLASQNFDDYDAIVLANVTDLSPSACDAMAAYLNRGGGVMIFPGEHASPTFYNDELLEKRKMLPAKLGPPAGDPKAPKAMLTLAAKGFDHPIASLWNDPASGSPAAASFYRVMPLTLDAPAPAGASPAPTPAIAGGSPDAGKAGAPQVVLRYSDNSPAVVERTWGEGRVILFSSTASTKWNDLPARPGIFVPLLYRCIGSIVQRQDEAMNVRVGQRFTYHASAELLGKDVAIKPPALRAALAGAASAPPSNGAPGNAPPPREAPPDSRKIELLNQQPALTYDLTDIAGVYEVTIQDAPGQPMKFAAQSDPAESDLTELAPAQRDQLATVADVIDLRANGNEAAGAATAASAALQGHGSGTEFWLPLAIAAIVLGASEMCLAHWFSRPK